MTTHRCQWPNVDDAAAEQRVRNLAAWAEPGVSDVSGGSGTRCEDGAASVAPAAGVGGSRLAPPGAPTYQGLVRTGGFGTYTVESFTANTAMGWVTYGGSETHHWNDLGLPQNPR
jgi:hypothetical protein